LKKMLNVESYTAPFIADDARSAGATNVAYGTADPLASRTSPTKVPSPTPSANR
jgi:hypothetical protein